MLGRGASRGEIDHTPTAVRRPLCFRDHFVEGRRLLAMNQDGTRAKLHINHNNEVRNMNKRYTSLIAVLSFLAGPVACSDAGEAPDDSRGRESQALTALDPLRDVGTQDEVKLGSGTVTIGSSPRNTSAPGSATLTFGEGGTPVSTTGGLTLGPVDSSEVVAEELKPGNPLVPDPASSGGAIRLEGGGDDSPSTITWGSPDAGVEIHLGGNPAQACSTLRAACLSAGETEAACADLVQECEEAIANPSAPTDSIGFVSDCNDLAESCRSAGVPPEECAKAVEVCKSGPTADTNSDSPATIVTSCEELRGACERAGLSASECDEAVAACNNPPASSGSGVALGADCAALVAACVSYGISKEECEEVKKECEALPPTDGASPIRLQ